MTERELVRILQNNPELRVADGLIGICETPQPPTVAYVTIASEHDLQAAVIAECDRRALHNPAWGMVAAIPNGQYRKGQRVEPGLRAGLPDLVVLLPRHGYGAAFIELKYGSNKPSQLQMEWVRKLQEVGYWAGVYWTFDETMAFLEWYVEGA